MKLTDQLLPKSIDRMINTTYAQGLGIAHGQMVADLINNPLSKSV